MDHPFDRSLILFVFSAATLAACGPGDDVSFAPSANGLSAGAVVRVQGVDGRLHRVRLGAMASGADHLQANVTALGRPLTVDLYLSREPEAHVIDGKGDVVLSLLGAPGGAQKLTDGRQVTLHGLGAPITLDEESAAGLDPGALLALHATVIRAIVLEAGSTAPSRIVPPGVVFGRTRPSAPTKRDD